MKDVILVLVDIVNAVHDIIFSINNYLGFNMNDKDLHLWVIGLIGIFSFLIVQVIFKQLAKYSITAISFIYTFTVLIVIVFAVEIQQKITGRGQMDFIDAVIGLWGFIIFFLVYLVLRLGFYYINRFIQKTIKNKNATHSYGTRFKDKN